MIISFSLLLFMPRTAYSSDEYDETAHKYRVQQNITNISERPQYVPYTHTQYYMVNVRCIEGGGVRVWF